MVSLDIYLFPKDVSRPQLIPWACLLTFTYIPGVVSSDHYLFTWCLKTPLLAPFNYYERLSMLVTLFFVLFHRLEDCPPGNTSVYYNHSQNDHDPAVWQPPLVTTPQDSAAASETMPHSAPEPTSHRMNTCNQAANIPQVTAMTADAFTSESRNTFVKRSAAPPSYQLIGWRGAGTGPDLESHLRSGSIHLAGPIRETVWFCLAQHGWFTCISNNHRSIRVVFP